MPYHSEPQQFVAWLRAVAPYIHAFRGKTIVVGFAGELVTRGRLNALVQDLSLLHAQLQRPIVHSYIQGTQPDAGYALPAPPYTLVILRSKMTDAKEGQFLLKSSGTSSPRPILLVQRALGSGQRWYVRDWSALLMPVR